MLEDRLPWYLAGPLIGLAIVALRWTINKPFGALGGWIDVTASLGRARPSRIGPRGHLLIGLVLGGLVFALARGATPSLAWAGGAGPVPAAPAGELLVLLGAGFAMGFGARTAGGCTSGHGLSGISLGSPASLVATMTFFATAVGLAQLFALLGGPS